MSEAGLLVVFFDPPPPLEEEFHDWYDTEHLPERAAIDGFLTARRYVSLGDGPRYAAIYDLTDLAVLESEAYRAVAGANFSPWSKRIMLRGRPQRLSATLSGKGGITGQAARLFIVKFALAGPETFDEDAERLRGLLSGTPGLRQLRLFRGVEPEADFGLALAESAGNSAPVLDGPGMGEFAGRIRLAATYRPYLY